MAQQRLTVAIKEQLVDQLILHAFKDRCNKLVDAECLLAQELYDDYLDTRRLKVDGGRGASSSLRKIIASLPAGWAEMDDDFKVEIGGTMTRFDRYDGMPVGYQDNIHSLVGVKQVPGREKQKWKFTPNHSSNYAINVYDVNHEVTHRATVLQNERVDLTAEISAMRHSARATLDSVTTIQKLIMIWPEVESFAAPFLQEKTAAAVILPVASRERLNNALGLLPSARVMEPT